MSAVFDIGGGCKLKVNDPSLIPSTIETLNRIKSENEAFHQKMIAEGVIAYRVNDGWVDREKHIVTFFSFENEKGHYWSNGLNIKVGDKICLITGWTDECLYAIVDDLVNESDGYRDFHYTLCETEKPKRKSSPIQFIKKLFGLC